MVQANLLQEFRPRFGVVRPNLLLFDIQPDQASGVSQTIAENGLTPGPMVPIVTMRISAIRGVPVRDLVDTVGQTDRRTDGQEREEEERPTRPEGWALRREYRSTYRDSLATSERVVEGHWWNRAG